MKTFTLQVTYRKGKPIAAYIYLPRTPDEKVKRTSEPVVGLLVDFANDDHPIGIEIRSPGYVTIEQIQELCQSLGLGQVSASELAPLRAALSR